MKIHKYNGSKVPVINNTLPLCEFNNTINETHSFTGNYSTQFTAKLSIYVGSIEENAKLDVCVDSIIIGRLVASPMLKGNTIYLGTVSLADGQTIIVESVDDLSQSGFLSVRLDYEKTYLGD